MSSFFKDNSTLGVIISRMQVPWLTRSHENMIKTVQARHPKMLILLGVSEKIDNKNPFDFLFRLQMLTPYLRETDIIMPVRDNSDNKKWVNLVDTIISCNLSTKEEAIIYGGRDSFIPYYKQDEGIYTTQELMPEDNDSGTDLRTLSTLKTPTYTRNNAEVIIYTVNKVLNERGLS